MEELRGDCNDDRRVVTFRVTVHDIQSNPAVIADIYTGDLSSGSNATISVYYPDLDNPDAWQEGDDSNSRFRLYTHLYPAGVHEDVRIVFAPLPGLADCPDVPLSGDGVEGSGRPTITVSPCGDDSPPCPLLELQDFEIGGSCNADGERSVSFSARADSAALTGQFVAETGTIGNDGEFEPQDTVAILDQGSSVNAQGQREFHGSLSLPAGSYRIRLQTDCGNVGFPPFYLAPCQHPCPKITFPLVSSSIECVDGERISNVTVDVRLPPGWTDVPLQVEVVDENGSQVHISETSPSGQLGFTLSHAFPAGQHTLTVNVLSPADCAYPDGSNRISFESLPCVTPPPPGCPVIEAFNVNPAASCSNGLRTVSIAAAVTIPPGNQGTVNAELADDAGVIDSGSADSGLILLSGSRAYPSGSQDVSISVSSPGCDPLSVSQTVQTTCDGGNPRPPWLPDWVPEPPTWLCFLWGLVNILLLVTTAIMIVYNGCLWPVVPLYVLTIALAICTLGSLVLYVLLCAWKPDACPCARWLPRLITFIGMMAGILALVIGIVGAIVSVLFGEVTLPCFIGVIVSSAAEFAYYFFLVWVTWELLLVVDCEPLAVNSPYLPETFSDCWASLFSGG